MFYLNSYVPQFLTIYHCIITMLLLSVVQLMLASGSPVGSFIKKTSCQCFLFLHVIIKGTVSKVSNITNIKRTFNKLNRNVAGSQVASLMLDFVY